MSIDLHPYQTALSEYLLEYLDSQSQVWSDVVLSKDVFDRLQAFVVTGKLWRGSLTLAAYQLFSQKDFHEALPLAGALEFMHSALLIHDDIIDRDIMRRGKPSIMAQYRHLATQEKCKEPNQVGDSLALCVGDISFFLGFQLLSEVKTSAYQKLLLNFAREYQYVGFGEMQDVEISARPEKVGRDEILDMYRAKTARYTFAVPILLAGITAGAQPELLKQLEVVGETIGLLFQIKDDYLGIFGSEAEVGKPVTSDVREGKKTLYYSYAFELAKGEQLATLQKLFGKVDLTVAELEKVKDILSEAGVVAAVEEDLRELEVQARTEIRQIPDITWQATMIQILEMNLQRKA